MKEEFLKFLNALMEANPELTNTLKTDKVDAYIKILEETDEKPKSEITDNGKAVLAYLQTVDRPLKAADIANEMGIASKSVSGTIRKLVTDKFVEKIPGATALYIVTEKGKNYKLN